jgi:hypothetical protein
LKLDKDASRKNMEVQTMPGGKRPAVSKRGTQMPEAGKLTETQKEQFLFRDDVMRDVKQVLSLN